MHGGGIAAAFGRAGCAARPHRHAGEVTRLIIQQVRRRLPIRREPAVLSFQGNFYPSLDIAAALAYTNDSLDQVKVVLNPSGVEKIMLGQRTIPTDHPIRGGGHLLPTRVDAPQ